jgi:flavin-dependent dehydrogenase
VLLVERDEFPRHKVCGEFISPEAQNVLHDLGLYEQIAALGPVPLHATKVVSRFTRKLQRPLPGEAWGLSRYRLDAGLAAAAQAHGVELRFATTANRCGIREGHVQLQLRDRQGSSWVKARTAIMAYGRSALHGLAAEQKSNSAHRRYVGAKCHYTGVRMAKEVELYFFPGGYAGINPIEESRTNLCILASYEAFARAGSSIGGILSAAIAGNRALARKMAGATALPETECAVAPVDTQRAAQPWGNVAQIGDSAVMLPPLCGDGMAMALRSAQLCAPLTDAYLRGTISLATWQRRYEQAWSQEFGRRVWLGRQLQTLLQVPVLAEGMLLTGSLFPALADYFIASTRGVVAPHLAASSSRAG